MGNRTPVAPIEEGALVEQRLRALREAHVEGISRRTLLRRSLGLGVALWLAEVTGGSISFLWSAGRGGGGLVKVGTLEHVEDMGAGLPFRNGFPVYVATARAFVVLVDPKIGHFLPGVDDAGDGHLNVRALSQVCPHLGCRPNPCIEDFWFHCPCHQSRYDRLGIKPAGSGFGPAERGMDRFALEVDDAGELSIDTSHITLGPLPIPLGQPGVIPPLVPHQQACK